MDFRIADTFTESLAKLQGDEQASAKTTAFDLQMNPANPGMQLHKLDRAKDKNFWSIRVSRDIRIIVHRTPVSLLLCYVGHHDPAYRWAERRKIERHPTTGAMQIVEIRERILEIEVPKYVEAERPAPPKPLLFAEVADDRLLAYGVPAEWLEDVKRANEDTLFELTDHLPAGAVARPGRQVLRQERPPRLRDSVRVSGRAALVRAGFPCAVGERRYANPRD
jgi:mRNA-degrading endonuclease RelE of RelBE toxin-antitoxin system